MWALVRFPIFYFLPFLFLLFRPIPPILCKISLPRLSLATSTVTLHLSPMHHRLSRGFPHYFQLFVPLPPISTFRTHPAGKSKKKGPPATPPGDGSQGQTINASAPQQTSGRLFQYSTFPLSPRWDKKRDTPPPPLPVGSQSQIINMSPPQPSSLGSRRAPTKRSQCSQTLILPLIPSKNFPISTFPPSPATNHPEGGRDKDKSGGLRAFTRLVMVSSLWDVRGALRNLFHSAFTFSDPAFEPHILSL